jgi:hypothetical protein
MRRLAATALLAALVLCVAPKQTASAGIMADKARDIAVGQPVTDNLPSSKDEWYYRFALPSTGKVNVIFEHDYKDSSEVYWKYHVFDASESEVLYFESRGDVSYGESMNAYLSSGVYYIRVRCGDYSWSHWAIDYKLTVNFVANNGEWEIEPNDVYKQASVIDGKSIVGNIRTKGDEDWYQFTLPASTSVTIGFEHDYADSSDVYWKYKVLDADMDEILSVESKGNDAINVSSSYLNGGVYYIRVRCGDYSWSHRATDYTLSVNYDAPAPVAPTTPAAPQAQTISVQLNGISIAFDQPPIIENDRTLVPLRAIFEAMGAVIEWDGNTRTVTATKGGTVIVMIIGNDSFTRNGVKVSLDVPAKIVSNRTLVPARAVAESFGARVEWDGNTRVVTITTS